MAEKRRLTHIEGIFLFRHHLTLFNNVVIYVFGFRLGQRSASSSQGDCGWGFQGVDAIARKVNEVVIAWK